MTPDEVATIKRLADEFKSDLAALGVQMKAVQARLDALSKDVQDIKDRLDKLPTITGDFFVGVRSDQSRFGFVDYSGAARGGKQSFFQNVDTPHDFHLGVNAKLSGGVTFTGDIVASNYLSYRGGNLSGPPTAAHTAGLPEVFNVYQAHVDVPITQFGTNTVLTLGRYKEQLTPLTYWRPDYDAYFDLPWYDDGKYVQDGFKLTTKFGSATTTLFAAGFASLTDSTGANNLNNPIIGSTLGLPAPGGGFFFARPASNELFQAGGGGVAATQTAGIHVGVPIMRAGELGLTAIDLSTGGAKAGSTSAIGGPGYDNLVVYAANFTVKPIGRWKIDAEGAKSVTQAGFQNIDGLPNDDNNAYRLNVGWGSHGFDLHGGYNYIDPRFSAPGYWLKIGNWYNPTNVQGPFAELGYNLTHALKLDLRGDYLSGARNRGADFTQGTNLTRAKAGLAYTLNKTVSLTADYEGVFFSLSGAQTSVFTGGAVTGRTSPLEQFITIGAGLNLSGNTVLKLAYQIINVNDVGGGFGGVGAGGATSNASVFTTQVAVHF
jgi:hypothetical protein